jgi:hypothetical protein
VVVWGGRVGWEGGVGVGGQGVVVGGAGDGGGDVGGGGSRQADRVDITVPLTGMYTGDHVQYTRV